MLTVTTLRTFVVDLVDEASGAHLDSGEHPGRAKLGWWRKPILATSAVDDRFRILTEVASRDHLLPMDLLPTARTVITFFLPFTEALVRENREGDLACRNWGLAYVETNALIASISDALGDLLARHGYQSAVTPPTHNFDEERLVSRWSHRHLAYLTGLGRFGVHAQLITPKGSAGRMGSLVTDADLGDHPLHTEEETCLHKAGGRCLVCVDRCPVDALGEESFDRFRCWEQCLVNDRNLADLPTTDVCGKCVAVVPCSFRDPGKRTP